METIERIRPFTDNIKYHENEETRRRALSNLIEEFTDMRTKILSKDHMDCVESFKKLHSDSTGLIRSASVAVLNNPGECDSLDVDEHKFFAKLKGSSKEMRNIMWTMHERRQRKEAEEELMKCTKNRKAVVKSALEAVKAVEEELSKATSLTVLRGRLSEAETNNKELKESIFHKMSDRSLIRLSAQPDLPRLVRQIVSLKSQVSVLQDRLRIVSEKLQSLTGVPPNQNEQDSSSCFKDNYSASATTLSDKPRIFKSKSRTGWKFMSRIFGVKKIKEA